jgi:hypothetical protein
MGKCDCAGKGNRLYCSAECLLVGRYKIRKDLIKLYNSIRYKKSGSKKLRRMYYHGNNANLYLRDGRIVQIKGSDPQLEFELKHTLPVRTFSFQARARVFKTSQTSIFG